MNIEIELVNRMGKIIAETKVFNLDFLPSEGETMHLEPSFFNPKIKGYEEDECVAVKVFKRSFHIPRKVVTIRAIFDESYGIPQKYYHLNNLYEQIINQDSKIKKRPRNGDRFL